MVKDILKNILVFLITFALCIGSLLLVCQIPQSAIAENSRRSAEYFSENDAFPLLLGAQVNTRMDNYADCVLFNVIYHVDADNAFYSIIANPYYRIEGSDASDDYGTAVMDGKTPNSEYSRYWHGSQVFIRPLLTVLPVKGIRLALFGLLLALNLWLAVLLLRRRMYIPAAAYFAGLLLVQAWMCAFTLEYIMRFLVMTGTCIAIALIWSRAGGGSSLPGAKGMASGDGQSDAGRRLDGARLSNEAGAALVKPGKIRDKRITYVFIASGAATCFLDFLTAETLTFTAPAILFLLLCKQSSQMGLAMTGAGGGAKNAASGKRVPGGKIASGGKIVPGGGESFKVQLLRLVKWGCAWLASYALMFAVKWGLVYFLVGKSAFVNALENAALRMDGAVTADGLGLGEVVTGGEKLLLLFAKNIGCLFPLTPDATPGLAAGLALGTLAILAAVLYLFRGERLDGAFIGILLLTALIPYVRYLCLSNHAYIHYFFTYRAQMAGIMAAIAILAYHLQPSLVLGKGGGSRRKDSRKSDKKSPRKSGGMTGSKANGKSPVGSGRNDGGKKRVDAAKNKSKKQKRS